MNYEYFVLWDQETRNLLLETEILDEALAFVRQYSAAFGDNAVLRWRLYGEDGRETHDSATLIAEGYPLAELARGLNAAALASA